MEIPERARNSVLEKKRTITGNSGIEKFKPKYLGGEKLPDGEIYYTVE